MAERTPQSGGSADEWRKLSDDAFAQLEGELRRIFPQRPSPSSPAPAVASDGEHKRRCFNIVKKARSRAARIFEENAALQRELAESRESTVNLMLRLARERRRWKASLLVVRRRLKGLPPSINKTIGRLRILEEELVESQKTSAELLVEITRRARRAEAERKRRTRGRRAAPAAAAPAIAAEPLASGALVMAAAARLNESLRVLVESPAVDPEVVSAAAEEGRRLARSLRLISVLLAPPRPSWEAGPFLKDRADGRLDLWENEIKRRHLTCPRMGGTNLPRAWTDAAAFDAILDEMIGSALERAPHGSVVMFKIAASKSGGLAVELSGKGVPGDTPAALAEIVANGGALPGLGFALARKLAERWGGVLDASSDAGGHEKRMTLLLSPTPSPEMT